MGENRPFLRVCICTQLGLESASPDSIGRRFVHLEDLCCQVNVAAAYHTVITGAIGYVDERQLLLTFGHHTSKILPWPLHFENVAVVLKPADFIGTYAATPVARHQSV